MAGVPPPPRQLDVRRFAAVRAGELRSLHESVSARLGGLFKQPRSARRRTTGHLPSKKRRRRSGDAEAGDGTEEGRPMKRQTRRVRRRRELAGNPAEGFSVAGDGARRLRTHLWHAKRFSMEKRWGFVLPIGAQGRGRGSRTVLKRLKNGTVVHDASYFTPVELDGPEDSLLSVVRMVLHPSPQDKSPGLKHLHGQVMRGVCYENAMLCRVGSPHPEIVGPVTYMWRPFLRESGKLETEDVDLSNSQIRPDERNSSWRQLWIWIHPAALSEGLETLRVACQQQMQESGDTISCCSLEGKMARLEVMGSNAMQSLKSILNPVSNPSISTKLVNTNNVTTTDPLDSSTGSHLLKASVFDNADILQSGAILSMIVRDPRDNSVQGTDSSKTVSLDQDNQKMEECQVPNADEASSEIGNILSSIWLNPGNHDLILSDCRELWDSSLKINPPVDEEILCMERHQRRIRFFCLDSGNDQGQTTKEKDSISRSFPVILLKHAKGSLLSVGWSVILPLSWVKPFWFYLVSHGAHAIGLRERRWIASKFKMPCFPYDYPDSKAYSLFMAEEAAVFDKATNCRPSAMRPPRVPVPPLWHCVIASFRIRDGIVSTLEVDDLKHIATALSESLPVNSNSGDAESSPTNAPTSFQLHMPRTIQMLRHYVKEFDEKYLSSSDMEAVTDKSSLVSGDNVKMGCSINRLCLVRVLIRAFKEGSFEEGAVVCAPLPSDLSAWNCKTRSEEEEEECLEKWELQLPQSHVSFYFSWLDPSISNLQLPDDDSTRKAFRWPIGFVTTGFVHGSSGQDAVAVALCEAKLLAVLRQQQWKHESLQRKDICVLVRNARSAAYRRALATIVLEQQDDDLMFL